MFDYSGVLARQLGTAPFVRPVQAHPASCTCSRCGGGPRMRRAVLALEAEPDRPYTEIARQVGASAKTVRSAARRLGLPLRVQPWEDCGHRLAHRKWHINRGERNPDCALCSSETRG